MIVARIVALVTALLLSGCGISVTPPADPAEPVSVFIADHGIHTSLLLPRENGKIAQFAYSQWHWAALDQDHWYRSPFALIIPNDGTIGRRDFDGPCDYDCVKDRLEKLGRTPPMQSLHEFRVSRAAAAGLLAKLDHRWESQSNGNVFNEKRGMWFVRDATKYGLFHNCNHEIAGWVRELGCRVGGGVMTADVSVHEATYQAPPAVGGTATSAETSDQSAAGK